MKKIEIKKKSLDHFSKYKKENVAEKCYQIWREKNTKTVNFETKNLSYLKKPQFFNKNRITLTPIKWSIQTWKSQVVIFNIIKLILSGNFKLISLFNEQDKFFFCFSVHA